MLTDDDLILASAARFLFETGQDEAARTLLTCSICMDENEVGFALRRQFVLTAPTAAYLVLQQNDDDITRAVKDALMRAVPRPPLIFGNQLDIVVGYPEREPEEQATLLQFAHGADSPSPVTEAPPSREGAPQMLITPLSIFPVEQVRRENELCFVIMPFASAYEDVYNYGIKPGVEDASLTALRGDDIQEAGNILSQIWTTLLKARFVIADLTGTNGNVLYELGLAHAIGHSVILLTQDINNVPFDLRPQRHIVYAATRTGIDHLRAALAAMLRAMQR